MPETERCCLRQGVIDTNPTTRIQLFQGEVSAPTEQDSAELTPALCSRRGWQRWLRSQGGMRSCRLPAPPARGPAGSEAGCRAPWSGQTAPGPSQVCTPTPSAPWGCMEQGENNVMAVLGKLNREILLRDSSFSLMVHPGWSLLAKRGRRQTAHGIWLIILQLSRRIKYRWSGAIQGEVLFYDMSNPGITEQVDSLPVHAKHFFPTPDHEIQQLSPSESCTRWPSDLKNLSHNCSTCGAGPAIAPRLPVAVIIPLGYHRHPSLLSLVGLKMLWITSHWLVLLLKIKKISASLSNLLAHPNFHCILSFSCRSVQHKLIIAWVISNILSQCSVDNKTSLFPYSNVRGMGSAVILDDSCAIKSSFHLRRWTWKQTNTKVTP